MYGDVLPRLVKNTLHINPVLPCACPHPWTLLQFTVVDLRQAGYDREGRVISTVPIATIHEIVQDVNSHFWQCWQMACAPCKKQLRPLMVTLQDFRDYRDECFSEEYLPDIRAYF